MKYVGNYSYKTDPGKVRLINEDQVNVLTNKAGDIFMIVCDGIGGQAKGDYASSLAVNQISEAFLEMSPRLPISFKKKALKEAIREANSIIYEEANKKENCANMGTTLVAVLISKEKMIVANAGDSRAYSITKDKITQLTSDQTYVNYLYRSGKITKEQILTHPERHVLMNALGTFPSLSLDLEVFKYSGECILLCSDGLYNNLNDLEIHAVCKSSDRVEQKVNELIKEANSNGGSDNIAVALWEANHD